MAKKVERALAIIELNAASDVRKPYDFEVFRSMAKLLWHTTQTYKDLSEVEHAITQAHRSHFEDHQHSYEHMEKAADVVEKSLARRQQVFDELVATWEKVRLPKGLSTTGKKYFFQQDRARHFANRVPDMTYLIYDEDKLGMEKYLAGLREYMSYYKKMYLSEK
jgi:hypothetical protein